MADLIFPANDLDRPKKLLDTLGSFWASLYQSREQVLSYVESRAAIEKQSERSMCEAIAAVSRFDVPIFDKDNWRLLTLKESERNDAQTSLLKYDDPDVAAFYNGSHLYDRPLERDASAFPRPSGLVHAPMIFNRITSPSLSLTHGIDFIIDESDDAVVFRTNPFDNPLVATRPIFDDAGNQVDREAALWLFMSDLDFDRVFEQFGYVLGLKLKSSKGFRDVMNAIFDSIVGATAMRQVQLAFEAMTGIKLVQNTVETVELVDRDQDNEIVVTDKEVYKFSRGSGVLVTVGDTVTGGDSLTDDLQIIEFNDGDLPASLAALTMGKGFLAAGFLDDLVFENKDVPLEVTEAADHPSGFTFVKFGLGGFAMDVEKFFDDLHANGVEEGQTLAMLLDQRTNKTGQPTAFNLPDTINPLQFLVENVLRNNAFVVRVKVSQQLPAGVGLHNVRMLRKIIPPHKAMLLVVELVAGTESVTLSNVNETPATFVAMEPLVESVGSSFVMEDKITVRLISETCQ